MHDMRWQSACARAGEILLALPSLVGMGGLALGVELAGKPASSHGPGFAAFYYSCVVGLVCLWITVLLPRSVIRLHPWISWILIPGLTAGLIPSAILGLSFLVVAVSPRESPGGVWFMFIVAAAPSILAIILTGRMLKLSRRARARAHPDHRVPEGSESQLG